MAKLINNGNSAKVTAEGHPRNGQAGRVVNGGGTTAATETVEVLFDSDGVVEPVNTDDLTVLG